MKLGTLSALLCAILLVPAFIDPADAVQKRKKRVKPMAASPYYVGVPKSYRQEPARMIQIGPGRWVSTYGCFTDEGYGRFGSCDMREGPQ